MIPILLPCDRPQVIAGPGKDVEIIQHNPRGLIVQSQMTLDRRRNLYGGFGIAMLAVGDRNDRDHRRLVFGLLYDQHDRARAVLTAFDVARLGLITSEVGIRNDEADFGRRKFHAQPGCRLFLLFQQVVEVIVGRIHLRGFDRIRHFGGQFAQPIQQIQQRR